MSGVTGNSTDWFLLGNMHLVDCENEVFTCTSCMNIYTITDMKTFNDFSGEDLLQSTKIFQSLKLTSQELSVLKAVCITNPGQYLTHTKLHGIQRCTIHTSL